MIKRQGNNAPAIAKAGFRHRTGGVGNVVLSFIKPLSANLSECQTITNSLT